MLLSIRPADIQYIIEYLEEDTSFQRDAKGQTQAARSATLADDLRQQLKISQSRPRQGQRV